MSRGSSNIISTLIYAAIFIILEVAAVAMLKSSSSLQDIWINRLSHRVISSVWGGSERVRDFFYMKEKNEVLSRENMEMALELDRYRRALELDGQIARMESLPRKDKFKYLPANIAKMSRNSQHNYIIVDKGSEDGVVPQSGIITSHGVIGIINAVDKHYSYGLTFMNSKISVSSRVGREGSIAPLVWDGKHSNKAYMINLPLHFEANPGDTIYTSGFSAIFPPDIPLGTAGASKIVDGATNELEVTLFQDFSALRTVTIVTCRDRDEIEGLEISAAED